MATDKNTLKNWFKTGLKPLQAHFWAWLDSYWHKDEKIPMNSIEGIDSALENKAEISSVEAKANKDASGLSDDDKQAWKEALGVGELPSNIGTVDEGEKVGNTYTKEQVVELLGEKLDAPSGEGSAENFPFVVGVNEENESTKLPAGDLGKNIGNTDLQIPRGTVRTLDITGAKMQTIGLEDKSNDAAFNRQLIMDKHGNWASAPYIKYQFLASAITINNVTPPNISPRPTFAEDVERVLREYRTYQFEEINLSDFSQEKETMISSFAINSETDFIIEFQNFNMKNKSGNIGVGRGLSVEYGVFAKSENYGYGASYHIKTGAWLWGTADTRGMIIPTIDICLIIKTGGVLTVGALCNAVMRYQSFNANAELGDYKILFSKDTIGKIKLKRLS